MGRFMISKLLLILKVVSVHLWSCTGGLIISHLSCCKMGGIIYRPTHAIGQVKLSDIDMRIPSASPAAMSIAANRNVSLRSVRFLLQRDGKLDKFRALLNRQEVMNYIQANISGTYV